MNWKSIFRLLLSFWFLAVAANLNGQQLNVSGPMSSVNDSFFENFGVNFGFSLAGGSGTGSRVVGLSPIGQLTPNLSFSQNSSATAIPAFGGFDPGTGTTFGFGRISPNGGGFSLGFNFAQGSTRTSSSQAPSITIPNGGFGAFRSGAFRPFVTGVRPVVGHDNAVTRAIASGQLRPYSESRTLQNKKTEKAAEPNRVSSANYGDTSVAAIKAQKRLVDQAQKKAISDAIDLAKNAEQKKDYLAVRINIRKAIKLTGDAGEKKRLRKWLMEYSRKR